jgi:integrase
MLLTQAFLDNLQPRAERFEERDSKSPGLRIIVQPSGHRSWALRARVNGRQVKATIGPYPQIGLKDARRAADKLRVKINEGVDPSSEKRAARVAAKTKAAEVAAPLDLVERVGAEFLKRHAQVNNRERSWKETGRALKRDVYRKWGKRRLSSITESEVYDLLDEIVDRGAPTLANRMLSLLKTMGKFAVGRKMIDENIFTKVDRPSPEPSRDRALDNDKDEGEIAALLSAIKSEPYPFGPLVRMLLMTGGRRTEVAEAAWSEIDLDAKVWTLPASRSKNKKQHVVPLTDDLVDLLRDLPRFENCDFIFTNDGQSPVRNFNSLKRRLDGAMARKLGVNTVKPWVLHDVRRTVATHLQKLGVRLEVTEALLNHAGGSRAGIVGVYQRHSWSAEKRAALDAWAHRLREIETAVPVQSNVIIIAERR